MQNNPNAQEAQRNQRPLPSQQNANQKKTDENSKSANQGRQASQNERNKEERR